MLSNVRDLILRARVSSRSVAAVTAFVCSFGLPMVDSNVAWAQCEQTAKLLPSDGSGGDLFGSSVGISGDVAVVGVPGSDTQGLQSGSAHVFRFNSDTSTWIQEQELLATDGAAEDRFGVSVAVSGDVIVVGAWKDDDRGTNSGSAYVFRFNGSSWVEEGKLLASDGQAADSFGISVTVSGNVGIVGASGDSDLGGNSGSAYVFRFNGASWVQEQKLLASDGTFFDNFGKSVAAESDLAVIGAMLRSENGTSSGAAYIFGFNGSSWLEKQKLVPLDGAPADNFGASVTVSGNIVVVGAPFDDAPDLDSGSAYVFRLMNETWVEEQKLLPLDAGVLDLFGTSVAVSGDVAMVGSAQSDDSGSDSGAVYLFRFNGSSWVQEAKLLASDAAAGDRLGNSVGVSGEVSVVGAFHNGDFGLSSGSAYIFAGACVPSACTFDSDCDDLDGCTVDICQNEVCVHSPTDCGDGNGCTNDWCSDGVCQHAAVTNGTACGSASDSVCDNPDSCQNGTCQANPEPSGTPCPDDGDQCTDDTCDGSGGCTHPTLSNGTGCDDGNDCTDNDVCMSGVCQGDGASCDDGDACTTDTCNTVTGCVHTEIACDDGDACTIDGCDFQSGCVFDPIVCPAGESCVNGLCEPPSGCTFNSDCDDEDSCTGDWCIGGTCSSFPFDCMDGTVCVDGVCTAADGCVFDSDCNDGNACTTDLCNSGTCSNTPITCNDGDACTVDSCSGGTCVFDPINCDDADACTVDSCSGGACFNDPISCSDGDACTVDSCFGGVCFNDLIDCDDGDGCTSDMCFDGLCENTFPGCGLADGCCGPDCDGGNDPDCPTCLPSGASCTENAECCSNKCKGGNGNKHCKGN